MQRNGTAVLACPDAGWSWRGLSAYQVCTRMRSCLAVSGTAVLPWFTLPGSPGRLPEAHDIMPGCQPVEALAAQHTLPALRQGLVQQPARVEWALRIVHKAADAVLCCLAVLMPAVRVAVRMVAAVIFVAVLMRT